MNRAVYSPPFLFQLIAAVFLFWSPVLEAQDLEVDRTELQSVGDRSISFINYVGPQDLVNTLDEIKNIGRSLGSTLDPRSSGSFSFSNKYSVLHIVSPEIPEKLDADVFVLALEATVDHIRNLRTILAGYLEAAYKYETRDALLLAEFITYYNAVHRGDMDYFSEKYKAPVITVLDPQKAGLATHYAEWSGQTQILIPLKMLGTGFTPVVDTGVIGEAEVIEEMRREEDRRLDSRKDMVELREKEGDREQEALNRRRQELREKNQGIDRELQKTETPPSGGTEQKQNQIDQLEKERASVEEQLVEVEKQQKELDKQIEDTLRMRDEIAADENELLRQKDEERKIIVVAPPREVSAWFLMVDDPGDGIPYGRMVKYDQVSGKRSAVSEITSIRGRDFVLLPKAILVIAGKETEGAMVRPLLLTRETLEVIQEGIDGIFPGSPIKGYDGSYFLVTFEAGEWRIGRFKVSLERVAISQVAVDPWTSITFQNDVCYVQGSNGKVYVLNPNTLDLVATMD